MPVESGRCILVIIRLVPNCGIKVDTSVYTSLLGIHIGVVSTRANSLGQGQKTLLSTLTTTKEHIFGCC